MRQWTKDRYPENWREISKSLSEEVGYCEWCGKVREDVHHLTVHHKDWDPSNNDRSNLIVCCPKCHFSIQRNHLLLPGEYQLTLFGLKGGEV